MATDIMFHLISRSCLIRIFFKSSLLRRRRLLLHLPDRGNINEEVNLIVRIAPHLPFAHVANFWMLPINRRISIISI
jgi:hypothetical protein